MKKFIVASVALALLALTMASASAADGPLGRLLPRSGGWRSYSYQPAPVTAVQPGYRSFSYQPAPMTAVQPQYRSFSYQPASPSSYGWTAPSRSYGRSYELATNKALGRVN